MGIFAQSVTGGWGCSCLLMLSLVPGCDAGSAGLDTSTAATAADVANVCAASCGRRARCNAGMPGGADAGTGCETSCENESAKYVAHARADVLRALTRCYEGLACSMSDDGCSNVASIEIGTSPDAAIHALDVQRCLDKYTECKGGPAKFDDDDCGTLVFLIDPVREALARCYGLDCEGVSACVTSVLGA